MRKQAPGYDWEVHETVTEDEWVLTLFRIIPREVGSRERNGRTVLFQHGGFMDATFWLSDSPWSMGAAPREDLNEVAAFFTLADEGYDVWLGNNRATQYSNKNYRYPDADEHDDKDWYYNPESFVAKYSTGWMDMGRYDVPAMLDKVTEVSGSEKVAWVGYSQGTSQMFYALATDEGKISDKLERAVMLAPCVVPKSQQGLDDHVRLYAVLNHEGVILMNDPLPAASEAKICRKVDRGSEYTQEDYDMACQMYKSFQGLAPWPTKSWETYGQNAIAGRYQEFVENFGPGNIEGPLVSPGLGSIEEVPILMSVAENDESCDVESARRATREIGDAVVSFRVLQDAGHEYFWDATRTDGFLDEVRFQLEQDVEFGGMDFAVFEALHDLFALIFEMDGASFSQVATLSAASIAILATTF